MTFAILMTLFSLSMHENAFLGVVLDTNGKPVADVLVYVRNSGSSDYTDENGKFEIETDSIEGMLCFSAMGYESMETYAKAGEKLNVKIEEKNVSLDDVVVRANRYGRIRDYESQRININSFEVNTSPTAFGDALGILKLLPGTQSPGNDGKLYIRGGMSEESSVFVDGMLVYNPYTLSQKNVSVRSRFSPEMYQGIAMLSGGYGSKYGQAMSGILTLDSKDKFEDRADLKLTSTGISVSGSKSADRYQCYSSYAYTNMSPYGHIFKDRYNWNKYYENSTGDFLGIFKPSDKLMVKTQFSFSKAGVDYSYLNVDSLTMDNVLKERYIWLQSTMNYMVGKNLRLFLGSGIVTDKFGGTDLVIKNDSVFTDIMISHSKLYLEKQARRFTYLLGSELIANKMDQDYRYIVRYPSRLSNVISAGFCQAEFFPSEISNILFGIRGEYSSAMNKFNIAPRFNASLKLNDRHILSFSAGRYFQSPSIDYLKIKKELEYSFSDNLTFTYAYAKEFEKLQADIYSKIYRNLITYDEGEVYYRNIENNGYGFARGLDVFWKNNAGMFEYWITYSFTDTKRLYRSYTKSRMPDNISANMLKIDLKYWVGELKTMFGTGYDIESGSFSEYRVGDRSIVKKTPLRNSLTINISSLPANNLIIHFSVQNILGSENIYGYAGSSITGKCQAIKTPASRFFYLGIFYTFSVFKDKNQLYTL